MRVLFPAAIACCLVISFTSCSGRTLFGYEVGDVSYLEKYVGDLTVLEAYATKYFDKVYAQIEELVKVIADKKPESPAATNEIEKIAGDFSAGSGESVCTPGDAICEKEAFTPKTANEQGRPRYYLLKAECVL